MRKPSSLLDQFTNTKPRVNSGFSRYCWFEVFRLTFIISSMAGRHYFYTNIDSIIGSRTLPKEFSSEDQMLTYASDTIFNIISAEPNL